MASWKRPVAMTLLVAAIAFAGFFAAALASFSASRVVPALAFRWELVQALTDLLRWLPALLFLGLALALGSTEGGEEELASRTMIPTVLLAAAFSILVLLCQPFLTAARSSILSTSATFNASLEAARFHLEAGLLDLARSELRACESISGDDPRIEKVEELLSNAELKARMTEEPLPEAPAQPIPDRKTARDYYLKALDFSAKGDHFSAHYYAQVAERLDPGNADARRLQARSWEELRSRGAGSDPAAAALFSRKLRGYELLRSGDPVGAYAVFKDLASRLPTDPDVKRYLAESLAETERTAFFKDEYDSSLRRGSIDEVFLRLPRPGNEVRLLAAAGATFAGEAVYFRDLEYLAAPPGGPPSIQVRSPYAKLAGGRLFLLCVERGTPQRVHRPAWSAGPASGPASVLTIELDNEIAYRVLRARDRPGALDPVTAWKAAAEAAAYGIDPGPALLDLVGRAGTPFALFAAGLLGALAGARWRRRGGETPRGLYALAPFMAAAGLPAFLLAERVGDLIDAWTAAAIPGTGAVGVAAGVRAALLVVALLLVAGTRTDRSRAEPP